MALVITSTLQPDISQRTFSADDKEDSGNIHNLQVQQHPLRLRLRLNLHKSQRKFADQSHNSQEKKKQIYIDKERRNLSFAFQVALGILRKASTNT